MSARGEITRLLAAYDDGDERAIARLFELVYRDLRRIARGQRVRMGGSRALETTELVHEAYLKLVDAERLPSDSRGHFLAVAARAMRQILVDQARARAAAKRGGGEAPLPLEEERIGGGGGGGEDVLALNEALAALAARNERLVKVVECRYFAGLTEAETALALSISTRTVQRDWLKARAWLKVELERSSSQNG